MCDLNKANILTKYIFIEILFDTRFINLLLNLIINTYWYNLEIFLSFSTGKKNYVVLGKFIHI